MLILHSEESCQGLFVMLLGRIMRDLNSDRAHRFEQFGRTCSNCMHGELILGAIDHFIFIFW